MSYGVSFMRIFQKMEHIIMATHCTGNTTQRARFVWPTWGPPGSCRPQEGPMLAPWTLLSRYLLRLFAIILVIMNSCLCSISHNIYTGFIFDMVIIIILRGLYVMYLSISLRVSSLVKGLRLALEGFVVTRHKGTFKQQVKSWGR